MPTKQVATLFDIGFTLVYGIVYTRANLLCISLAKFFPMPTRNQMLSAYPKSFIKHFGHANVFAFLYATELGVEVASMKTVNGNMYSTYNHGSTMKWLTACCPIGSIPNSMIGSGHGGSISDPAATSACLLGWGRGRQGILD